MDAIGKKILSNSNKQSDDTQANTSGSDTDHIHDHTCDHSGDHSADHSGETTREEAEAAVQTLLQWLGEDPDREGLVDTPKRVVKAYSELFAGYDQDPVDELNRTFEQVSGYTDAVVVRDIPFFSHCEHHMVPITGKAHVAYLPDGKVVGLSKIARVVDVFAKRLQTQESMTAQIADSINDALKPKGVAVVVEAEHMCMAMRGIRKQGSTTVTSSFKGEYETDKNEQLKFMTLINS